MELERRLSLTKLFSFSSLGKLFSVAQKASFEQQPKWALTSIWVTNCRKKLIECKFVKFVKIMKSAVVLHKQDEGSW